MADEPVCDRLDQERGFRPLGICFEQLNAWERFSLFDAIAPGQAACGNVHFTPNGVRDYEAGSVRKVLSSCDAWLDYPRLNAPARLVSNVDWGCTADVDTQHWLRNRHMWWFGHLPHARGITSGCLNNWWEYIVNFHKYSESSGRQ